MHQPLVSITIPSYKPEHFEQSLRSAIGQSYQNIEILVSDNCPTEAIRDICARFPQVRYRRNPIKGVVNVTDSMFDGSGVYVKPLFDDDILHPFCVERMVKAMQLQADIELVFSASQVIDAANMRLQTRRPFAADGILPGTALYRMLAMGPANVVGELSSIMFKRARLEALGKHGVFELSGFGFDLGLADVALYCNLAMPGQAYYLDEELSYFRRDPTLASNSNPAANANYGVCLSDGIDLVLSAHKARVLSDDDLLTTRATIDDLAARAGALYPQVAQAYQRYLAYLQRPAA